MGVYKYYMSFNSRPAYHKSNGRRLYFLAGSGWLIGNQGPNSIEQGWDLIEPAAWILYFRDIREIK